MNLDAMYRYGIIFFSLMTIPFLLKLIYAVYKEIRNKKQEDKLTAYALLVLFISLLISAILSILVSGIATANEYLITPYHVNNISRTRSFLFSLINFLTSFVFYRIYKEGRK